MDMPVEYEPDDDRAVMEYILNRHQYRATLVNSQVEYLRELRDKPGITLYERVGWAMRVRDELLLLQLILEEELSA